MILVYHDIKLKSDNENTVSLLHFFCQMCSLKLTKKVVSLEDYFNDRNKDNCVITFDDGYKHIRKYAFPILKLFGFPFTLFVCSDFVKSENKHYLNVDDLEYLSKNGGNIQYHTKTHKNLTEIKEDELLPEIEPPPYLKDISANSCEFFAYPYWKYNEKIKDIVKKYYKGARSGNGYADNTDYALDSIKVMNMTNLTDSAL